MEGFAFLNLVWKCFFHLPHYVACSSERRRLGVLSAIFDDTVVNVIFTKNSKMVNFTNSITSARYALQLLQRAVEKILKSVDRENNNNCYRVRFYRKFNR